MTEITFPLLIWKRDYWGGASHCLDFFQNKDKIWSRKNITDFIPHIRETKRFFKLRLNDNVEGYVVGWSRITKKSLSKWQLKLITDKYSHLVIKEYIFNDVGMFVVIENAVFNEIVECHRKIHKNQFCQHIWCEMIKRVMRPDRLVKMAGLYDLGVMDYIDLMGF
jgi:hypothetical protein